MSTKHTCASCVRTRHTKSTRQGQPNNADKDYEAQCREREGPRTSRRTPMAINQSSTQSALCIFSIVKIRVTHLSQRREQAPVEPLPAPSLPSLDSNVHNPSISLRMSWRAGSLVPCSDKVERIYACSAHTPRDASKCQQCEDAGFVLPRRSAVRELESFEGTHINRRIAVRGEEANSLLAAAVRRACRRTRTGTRLQDRSVHLESASDQSALGKES